MCNKPIKIIDQYGRDVTEYVKIIYKEEQEWPVFKKTLKDYIMEYVK